MDALCIGAFVGRENFVTQTVRGPQPGSLAGVLDSLRALREFSV